MATHFSILAWEVPWTEEPGGLQSMRPQSQTQLSTHTYTQFDVFKSAFQNIYIYVTNFSAYHSVETHKNTPV